MLSVREPLEAPRGKMTALMPAVRASQVMSPVCGLCWLAEQQAAGLAFEAYVNVRRAGVRWWKQRGSAYFVRSMLVTEASLAASVVFCSRLLRRHTEMPGAPSDVDDLGKEPAIWDSSSCTSPLPQPIPDHSKIIFDCTTQPSGRASRNAAVVSVTGPIESQLCRGHCESRVSKRP